MAFSLDFDVIVIGGGLSGGLPAAAYLQSHGRPAPFGPAVHATQREKRERAAALFPVLRGLASTDRPQVGHFTDSDVVLDQKSTRLNSSHERRSRMPSSA